MRACFCVTLLLVGWAIVATANDPFDRVNDVLNNEDSLNFYAYCFLDMGPCSGDGRALKRLLPDFIATSCSRCSDRNKQMACKIIYTLQQDKYAHLWQAFLKKYDPLSQHRANLQSFMKMCRETYRVLN